jgi:hypothetical protein
MTASRTASSSRLFAAAERPTRPEYLRQACSAMAVSLCGGHWGKSSRTRAAKRSTYCWSSSACRATARCLFRSLASWSARHSCSACSNACSSTRSPCRSYRLRARLHLRTTATSVECLRERLVSAASPAGKKTRWSRSAHARHSAPFSLVNVIQALRPRSSPHSSQIVSLLVINTVRSSLRFTGFGPSVIDDRLLRRVLSQADPGDLALAP